MDKISKDLIKKNEKGSITLFVIVVMLFFIIFTAGVYAFNTNKLSTQMKDIAKIQEGYDSDENIDEIYDEILQDVEEGKLTYTIEYDGNGATSGTTTSSIHTFDVEQPLTANGFTRKGYSFKEWNTKPDGTGTSYADKAKIKNIAKRGETIILYAQWTDITPPVIISLTEENTNSNLNSLTNLIGVAKDNESGIVAYQFSTDSNLTANSTGWIPMDPTIEQITLKYEIGSNETYYFYVKDASNLMTKQSIAINNFDSRVGQYSSSSTSTTYCPGCRTRKYEHSTPCTTKTEYCSPGCVETQVQCRHTYSLAYTESPCPDCGDPMTARYRQNAGPICGSTTGSVTYGKVDGGCPHTSIYTPPSAVVHTVTQYSCPGHKVEYCPGHTETYCPGHTSTSTTWHNRSYTVKYNANNGTGSMSNSSFTCNRFGTLRQNVFTREGYTFIGWSKDANATIPTYADNAKVKNLSVDGSEVTLYAVWKKNK